MRLSKSESDALTERHQKTSGRITLAGWILVAYGFVVALAGWVLIGVPASGAAWIVALGVAASISGVALLVNLRWAATAAVLVAIAMLAVVVVGTYLRPPRDVAEVGLTAALLLVPVAVIALVGKRLAR